MIERHVLEAAAQAGFEATRVLFDLTDGQGWPRWSEASDDLQSGAIFLAQAVLESDSSSDAHDAECAKLRNDGWRWGPVWDGAAKKSPSLVPYADLLADRRAAGELFRSVVVAFVVAWTATTDGNGEGAMMGTQDDSVGLAICGGSEGWLDIITASRRILSLDADGDAAPPTEGTWRRATDFLVKLASAVGDPIHRLGKPRIWPGPDRSIDLYWETGETRLAFNVSAAGEATYYGSGPTGTIKGMTRVGLVDVDAGLLEAVRGLAEGAR